MSSSRKLKFRTGPRAPRYAHNKHAEPVPLANKFQELIEQDEVSPSQSRAPVQRPVDTGATASMAQRLQDLLGESASGSRRSSFDADHAVGVQRKSHVAGVFLQISCLCWLFCRWSWNLNVSCDIHVLDFPSADFRAHVDQLGD
jgi:hypothetical protein